LALSNAATAQYSSAAVGGARLGDEEFPDTIIFIWRIGGVEDFLTKFPKKRRAVTHENERDGSARPIRMLRFVYRAARINVRMFVSFDKMIV
jgi:hypothetical protein